MAAKNEAEALPRLLDSLTRLDYPRDKLQIIMVDDSSNDDTAHLLDLFAQSHHHVMALNLRPGDKQRPGKAGALLFGIAQSHGDFIFLTDADCVLPPQWIKTLLAYFDESVGLVGGFTLLDQARDNTGLFGKIQSCDWAFLLGIASAAAARKKPLSWVGNNMAFRRVVYEQIGGFSAIGNSLIEDFSLIKAINDARRWSIRLTQDIESLIISRPALPWKRLYQQRKRWASGIAKIRLFGFILLLTSYLAHLGVLLAFAFGSYLAFIGVALLAVMDFLILLKTTKSLKRMDLLRFFAGFQVFYYIYSFFLPLVLAFDRKIHWKGQEYHPSDDRSPQRPA